MASSVRFRLSSIGYAICNSMPSSNHDSSGRSKLNRPRRGRCEALSVESNVAQGATWGVTGYPLGHTEHHDRP
jgi:hypothetical protein